MQFLPILVTLLASSGQGVPLEAESTFPVEVAFELAVPSETREAWKPRETSPAADVTVELGLGTTDEHGSGYWARPVLARVQSDELGFVRMTFEVPAEWRDQPGGRIWARVAEPGHMRNVASFPLGGTTKPKRLFVKAGGDLQGTLLDPRGLPVHDASVGLVFEEPGGSVRRGSVRTDGAGRFQLRWSDERAGEDARILAWKTGAGVSTSKPRRLVRAESEPIEIRLGAGLPLAGRVLDPRGSPVPGLTIFAVPAAGFPGSYRPFRGEGSSGLVFDRATTDSGGRFELPCMAIGEYALHGSYSSLGGDPTRSVKEAQLGPVLGEVSVPSREPVQLISGEHRIEVSIVDHNGVSVAPTRNLAVQSGPDWWWHVWGIAVGDMMVYPVEPDREYLVSWIESERPYREERVQTSWQPTRVPVRLALERPGLSAKARVRVVGPDGAEPATKPAVSVRAADSGCELANTIEAGQPPWNRYESEGWTVELPPGRYELVATTPAHLGCVVPNPYPRTPLLPAVREVELLPGDELELELRLGAAGYLDFEPAIPRPELTATERDQLVPDNSINEQVVEAARERYGGARVALISPDGVRVSSSQFEVRGFSSFIDWMDWIVPGMSARGLSPLPVGEWTVRIERAGEVLLERPVSIAAGEVTTVTW